MPQSSITAWLKKPALVKKADAPTPVLVHQPESPREEEIPFPRPGPDDGAEASASAAFALPPLPSNVEMVPLTEDLMPSFKRLNSLTLPVPYPKSFYTESMTEPYHGLTVMALWHPTPPTDHAFADAEKPHLVGAIRCRLLPSSILYISTLCLLAPYRSHGIATHLLQTITARAAKEHRVKSVAAHVWEANDDGLEWYDKRGFEVTGKEEGYYSKLKPNGAMLVQKAIGVGDLLAMSDQAAGKLR